MFDVPTVFVLGAGASVRYGFPTAAQLVEQIIKLSQRPDYLEPTQREIGLPAEKFINLAEELRVSHVPSIDLWLETRKEFAEAGKIFIARVLLAREHPEQVNDTNDWYADLFYTYLRAGATNPEAITKNKVAFVTFNYDRSLEYSLLSMTKATYGLTTEQASEIVNKIPILHVYGQLGKLPWQLITEEIATEREYKPDASWGLAKTHARDIKIFSEGCPTDSVFKRARSLLQEAKRIYFIGFGFHHNNLERLNCGHSLSAAIVGSAHGLPLRLKAFLLGGDNPFGTGILLADPGLDAQGFLRSHVYLV